MKILGIIINLFLPGIGTIVVGRVSLGMVQFILYCFAVFLTLVDFLAIIGIPFALGVLAWSIISATQAKL